MSNQFTVQVAKMSDVMETIRRNSAIDRPNREAMESALRSLESWSRQSLKDIPANVPKLAELFGSLQPAALGIAPKTFANVKSLCLKALSTSELVPGLVRTASRGRPMDPVWAEIWNGLTMPAQRNNVSRLVNWCSRNGLSPQDVTTDVIDRIMDEMQHSSLRPDQHRVRRGMARIWNEIVDIFPHKQLQKVALPPSRLRRSRIPIHAFPDSFLEDWQRFSSWAHGDDVFADDARPVRLKQSTLDIMFGRVHLAASTLVQTGVAPAAIRSLADLVTVNAFKCILRQRHEAAGGKASFENFFVATCLIQIARDWIKVDEAHIAEMQRLRKKLPQVSFEMTRKNKLLVMQFDDSQVKERLLSAPDRIWQDVKESTRENRLRLAMAQASLGISILMFMPVRLGNLTALTFDKHLFLRHDGRSTLILSADETKTGAAVEFDIPPLIAQRLIEYREVIAPAVIGSRPKYLFANTDGSVKGFAGVRYLVQRYLKLFVGIHVNPHAFRHMAAKFILDASPGAHVLVQHLLGHKKLSTTATFYAGLDTKRAGRHHQVLIEQALVDSAPHRKSNRTPHRRAA